jgi:hypothetical protein
LAIIGGIATIYVAILDEDVDAWTPVEAKPEVAFFRIVGTEPGDERWQFPSGSLVRCEQRELSGGQALVAVEAA